MKKSGRFWVILAFALGSAPLAHAAAPASAPVTPTPGDQSRYIDLPDVLNARGLGGLIGREHVIPQNRFFRTANLDHLTPVGKAVLLAHHVVLDIDLRSAQEQKESPDVLAHDPAFHYVRVSLLGPQAANPQELPDSLSLLYVQALAADQAKFREVFELIAAQKHGAVLFHCTAGKDRTGMIAAMLLSLAGVSQDAIVHNYALSAYYLKPMMNSAKMQSILKKYPNLKPLMAAPPRAILSFLNALQTQYGGTQAYLRHVGVSTAQLRQIKARLGQA